jgi:outer membrane protein insertion porin family
MNAPTARHDQPPLKLQRSAGALAKADGHHGTMRTMCAFARAILLAALLVPSIAASALAQVGDARESRQPTSVCGLPVPRPASQPPAGSEPVVLAFLLCFEKQGGSSMIDPQTYLYHIQLRPSEPSRDKWIAYTDEIEHLIRGDFQRLWATSFLDDLSIEAHDYVFPNGVTGKIVVFNMEERQRIRIVDYEGLIKVDQSAIEEKLKEKGLAVRLDSFLDPGTLKRVASVVRQLYAEKGYQYAEVTPEVKEAEGPKVVHITFNVVEGPKVAIRDVEFIGNRDVADATLAKVLKENKAEGLLTLMNGKGTFKEDKFADDAQAIVDYYRDRGYINAQVGQPVLKVLDDSGDGRTRWVQMRVPVTEGKRHAVGDVSFEGNTIVNAEALRRLFKLKSGETYSQKDIRKGLETARDVYGSGGYFEFTGYPDLRPRAPGAEGSGPAAADPIVDVTIRVDEGKQYFINRITFAGNTHTRDPVIRRELALVEAGVFNTQALKNSIQRLNQLGYFKALEADGVNVEKAQGTDNKVDIELKVEEQNRNQISFGAGASQNEGFFGNASFTTSNFLGRGESVTVSLQKGTRANNYQIAFSEPFVFGRPITMGVAVFSRKIDYQISSAAVDYSEVRTGVNLTTGLPLRRFTRGFVTYGYEVVDTAASNALAAALETDSSVSSAFLLAEGRHTESSMTPSIVHNTVDNPFAPRRGVRLTGRYQYAGGFLGGTSDFIKPDLEAIVYRPVTRRTALGVRAQAGWVRNYGSTELPYYLRYFLGGETQIRGTDIRTVGPTNANGVALGGTKFVLFNAEYYFDVAPQVRALLFHDAGQAFSENQAFNLRQLRTSTGAELRVTLPVIGVPFRLIYAWNIYRDTSQPARTFKFAVGTTF